MAHTQHNESLTPVTHADRVFNGYSHASLWFSLGVGLLVMQVGSYLVPRLGTQEALWVILLGSLLGAGLLGWVAKVGCDTGLSSAGLMHQVFGSRFARVPVLLNMVQLVGWTTFELVIMRDGTLAMTQASHWSAPYVATLLWGGVLVLLMTGSMLGLVRNFLSKFGLPLVVLSLVWLSWQFIGMLQAQGWEAFWHKPGNEEKSYMISMELVIAMPVSWLPLIADYARFGKNSRSAMTGSWLGYAIANIWCYALGVMVVSVSAPDANLVNTLLLAQGGLLALGLILLDEIDNAYGDVYSASVNSHSIWPAISAKQWGILIALVCTALAMVLPMHSLEPFLLMLSSVFVPLFGVILGRMGWGQVSATSVRTDTKAVLSWLAGIAVYQLCMEYSPYLGYAMPSLLTTLLLGWLTRPVNAKASLA